jgi:hypothetical protein
MPPPEVVMILLPLKDRIESAPKDQVAYGVAGIVVAIIIFAPMV